MKSFASFLLLLWTAVVSADPNENSVLSTRASDHPECTFDDILMRCGSIRMHSIDDSIYGYRPLIDWKVNVVNPVAKYANKLKTDPYVEGRDNPDVAIAYAFMHYICFDSLILDGEEHKIYECMLEKCPRIVGIEEWCEGMNSGGAA